MTSKKAKVNVKLKLIKTLTNHTKKTLRVLLKKFKISSITENRHTIERTI